MVMKVWVPSCQNCTLSRDRAGQWERPASVKATESTYREKQVGQRRQHVTHDVEVVGAR